MWQMIPKDDLAILNDIATRSFRNVADQDYISARLCYRAGLMLQFVWMSEQAIEKYLKGILLFNQETTHRLGHSLDRALTRVKNIRKLNFSLSTRVERFIEYLDQQGVNRYLEQVHYTRGSELTILDRCVWEIRMYCKTLDYKLPSGRKMLPIELEGIRAWKETTQPHKFAITGGVLEQVNRKVIDPRRPHLIWKNMFYGKVSRKHVEIPTNTNSINPPQVMHPEKFDLLDKYVAFPKHVRDHFKT